MRLSHGHSACREKFKDLIDSRAAVLLAHTSILQYDQRLLLNQNTTCSSTLKDNRWISNVFTR